MKVIYPALFLVIIWGYLGSYSGKLCLYDEEKTNPIRIFPYSITIFPQKDQTMLNDGIPYESKEEFSRLIEDFLS